MSEKLTNLEQLRMAAEKSKELSARVAAAAADAIEELSARAVTKEVLAGKQDKLTGIQGQIVGFDGEGNAVPQTLPSGGVTSFSGRTGAVTPKKGDYSVSDVTGGAHCVTSIYRVNFDGEGSRDNRWCWFGCGRKQHYRQRDRCQCGRENYHRQCGLLPCGRI